MVLHVNEHDKEDGGKKKGTPGERSHLPNENRGNTLLCKTDYFKVINSCF